MAESRRYLVLLGQAALPPAAHLRLPVDFAALAGGGWTTGQDATPPATNDPTPAPPASLPAAKCNTRIPRSRDGWRRAFFDSNYFKRFSTPPAARHEPFHVGSVADRFPACGQEKLVQGNAVSNRAPPCSSHKVRSGRSVRLLFSRRRVRRLLRWYADRRRNADIAPERQTGWQHAEATMDANEDSAG